MIHPLPMRFRTPFADEALPGYLSECAERYSAHPGALLELAGCPTSLRRSASLAPTDAERLAQLLGQQPGGLAAAVYLNAASARGIPLISFNGGLLRRSHLVASKRRLSPAAMRASNHIRALSLVEPIAFCPDSWTMLTDRCLNPKCGKPLSWQKLDHVSRCPACKCDQRDFETVSVPQEFQQRLRVWSDLIHPLHERRAASKKQLPGALQALDPGSVFDLVLGLAGVLGVSADRSAHPLEGIARATAVVLGWPQAILAMLDADTQASDAHRQSLSTHLRRYAQSAATLPDVRSLLMYDLTRERDCALGAKAEIAAARRQLCGLGVRAAAARIGIAPAYVTRLRRAGVLQGETISRGRSRIELVTYQSCDAVQMELEDRMSEAEFAQATGFSAHAIEQLVEAGLVEQLRTPAIEVLFDRPMLRRSSAERFIERLRAHVFPLGPDNAHWIPLAKAFTAVGGRPKPYGSYFTWLFDKGANLKVPVDADGVTDMTTLHVSPFVGDCLGNYPSEFSVNDEGRPVSIATTGEILNCDSAAVRYLTERGHRERCVSGDDDALTTRSVVRAARQLISMAEINARLGFQERSANLWLRTHGIQLMMYGFADRRSVEQWLREQIPYGMLRRNVLRLTMDDVHRGDADLTDREWDLVRAWVPRQRRSRKGVCDRSVVNGAIWVSATGQRWRDMPRRYGDADACYSRYHHWKRQGTLDTIFKVLARERRRQAVAVRGARG